MSTGHLPSTILSIMLTNVDCTVYNKYLVGRVETYQRVEIKAVQWEQRHARQGNQDNDFTSVYIPFERGADYLKPRESLSVSDKPDHWTLQIGDVIVKGIVTNELVAGTFTLSDLKRTYDDVLVINSVDTRDYGSANMQHWEVTCR